MSSNNNRYGKTLIGWKMMKNKEFKAFNASRQYLFSLNKEDEFGN